jgi:predicted Zn-dependent peptidase
MTQIYQHTFDNGLILLAEPNPAAQSLAMSMLTPAGVTGQPQDKQGVAAVLAEMICRGAGERDARAHSDALDQLGVQRSTNVETNHLSLGATMIGSKAGEALPLLLDMIRRPRLDESSLEPSRDLALQEIESLADEPQQSTFIHLRAKHFPPPFDRSSLGVFEHVESLTLDDVRAYRDARFVAGGSVIAFAGAFDWNALKDQIGELTGDWSGSLDEATPHGTAPGGYAHVNADTAQMHIGMAYERVPEADPLSIVQRAGVAVLSGGMSGRLFTEVREKRGLCYAVYATYAGNRHLGAVLSYAGTTVARAQETLDVMCAEHRRLYEGVDRGEFERAMIGMKSSLVMQGESTAARAHAIAGDQIVHGRPRTLDDRIAEVDGVTLDRLNNYLRDHAPGDMTLVTIGPEPLKPASP